MKLIVIKIITVTILIYGCRPICQCEKQVVRVKPNEEYWIEYNYYCDSTQIMLLIRNTPLENSNTVYAHVNYYYPNHEGSKVYSKDPGILADANASKFLQLNGLKFSESDYDTSIIVTKDLTLKKWKFDPCTYVSGKDEFGGIREYIVSTTNDSIFNNLISSIRFETR